MEENLPAESMIPAASYGVLDLQGSMHMHHQQNPHASFPHHQQQQPANQTQHQGSMFHPPMHDVFPMRVISINGCDQQPSVPVMDYNKAERSKTSTSDEDEPSFTEDGADGHNEAGRGKNNSPWHRMKWTDGMVRLLITAVSYLGEDAASDCSSGARRKSMVLQKKGKWKTISKVMAERGFNVSPQQCEDKFNDLNKRYKRLTDILGRGTSCHVVENPALLDQMNHISAKLKDDVRKILSSKHLFYEEMCSYHNANRLHLPHDPALQRSLQMALKGRDEHGTRAALHEDADEDDQSADTDDEEDYAEDHNASHGDVEGPCFPKRLKHGADHGELALGNPLGLHDCTRRPHPQSFSVDMNQVFTEGSNHNMSSRLLQLEEQRLHIQAQMLELEKQRFKWQCFSKKKDRELNQMKIENERMKLENERMTLELKHKEFEIDLNLKRHQ